MKTRSQLRGEFDAAYRAEHPEPAQGDLFAPAAEWVAWDEARQAALVSAYPWTDEDEAALAADGTTLDDGTVTY